MLYIWEVTACTKLTTIISIIYLFVTSILSMTAIYALYQFILNSKKETAAKSTQQCAILFVILNIFTLIGVSIYLGGKCWGIKYHHFFILALIYTFSYITQKLLIIIIFFDKMMRVFQKTRFRLSNTIKNIYYILCIIWLLSAYSITGIYCVCSQISDQCRMYAIIFSFVEWIFIILMISMIILFIQKLIGVYKNEENNESLIIAITKITVLFSVSLTFTFLSSISTAIYRNAVNSNIIFIPCLCNFIFLLDIYMGFLCVIMCFKQFTMYYDKICLCLDSKCRTYCAKIVNHNIKKIMELEIKQVAVPFSNGNNNDTIKLERNCIQTPSITMSINN